MRNIEDELAQSTGDLYLMIGSPISQVKSPGFFNDHFRRNEIDAQMIALDVAVDELDEFFAYVRQAKTVRGCVVTVPHKGQVVCFLDELSDRAQRLQSVNVICHRDGRLTGDMVDGLGFLGALYRHAFSVEDKRVALVGAGAAGGAIAYALAEAGAREIAVHEIDQSRCEWLASVFSRAKFKTMLSFHLENLSEMDLVINASPVGMNSENESPVSLETLSQESLVADMVTSPRETAWLKTASRKGCEIIYGEEVVSGQFALIGRHIGLEMDDSKKSE